MHFAAYALIVMVSVAAAPQAHLDAWDMTDEGAWQVLPGAPAVLRQTDPEAEASALQSLPGDGAIMWRCFVEPSPTTEAAGIWFAATPGLGSGYRLTLGGNPGVGGVQLHDALGALLWEDKYAPWTYYTPYILEGIAEPGRIRVQMLRWDGTTLEAQSDWIDAPDCAPDTARGCGLYARGVARFCHWEAPDTPVSPIVPDSPSRLRLITSDDSEWTIIGPGEWKWMTPERRVLRQGKDVHRSSVVNANLGGAEGTWQTRILLERGAGGGGLLLRTDPQVQTGFLVWLGGVHGAGSLMLYRMPLDQMWASSQDQWFYDTEYILEGTVQDGKVSGKLMRADGTVIVESPQFDLTEGEMRLTGNLGLMTYIGRGRFWDFSEETRAAAPASTLETEQAPALGPGWVVRGGDWHWIDGAQTAMAQEAAHGTAAVISTVLTGARGVYSATVTSGPEAEAVSLLFQVSPDLREGFELRLGEGAVLRNMAGRILFEHRGFAWTPETSYLLEGIVETDRVSLRITDTEGNVLLRADDFYVSDRNNTRIGGIGFQTINGTATFADWTVQPLE